MFVFLRETIVCLSLSLDVCLQMSVEVSVPLNLVKIAKLVREARLG